MSNVTAEVQIFNALRNRLAEIYSLDKDDEAILDTTAGETKLTDVIAAMIRESRVAKAQAEGVCALASEMLARSARLEAKHEKLRDLAKWALMEVGLSKLSEPDFSVSISKGRPKVITTREPDSGDYLFAKTKTTFSWERDIIKHALENGETLDFAYLANPEPVLTVRVK
jgi:hypothetical protein